MENSAQTRSATTPPRSRHQHGSAATARARGPRSWSPLTPSSGGEAEEDRYWLGREISLLERALADKGEMRRRDLGELVGCKYWGPGRFARALRAAVQEGRISHTGVGRYGPPS
jgi:hypothetical protein